jgi:geranylgeranyl diphosphate synthase type I
MATDPAGLDRIRAEVARALDQFIAGQREVLAAIGDDMLPWIDVVSELLAGGKRLRPAFCYWGWRAAGGADCPEIYAAAAALELLHASALVHDDVIDASDTRRGRCRRRPGGGGRLRHGRGDPDRGRAAVLD